MNKSEARELLNEIIASCPRLDCGGFYMREIRPSSTGNVELRLLSSPDRDTRKTLSSITASHGLKMEEVSGLLIIY